MLKENLVRTFPLLKEQWSMYLLESYMLSNIL